MIEKMKEVGDGSERLKQWREEAKDYVPENSEYDKNYWVAAYILYTNMEKFKDLFDRLDNINSELSELGDELDELLHDQEDLEYRIEDLRYKLESLLNEDEEEEDGHEEDEDEDEEKDEEIEDLHCKLGYLEEELEGVKATYEETLDRFCELEDDKQYLLWGIIELAEQLVAS
jgi:chromosome segregation ATPase